MPWLALGRSSIRRCVVILGMDSLMWPYVADWWLLENVRTHSDTDEDAGRREIRGLDTYHLNHTW